MKKIIFLLLTFFCLSSCQKNGEINQNKIMIFNKCVKLSHIHSDYLKFFYDNTQFSNFKSLNSTILFDIVNKTTQDFISKNNEFNKVSEQQKIQLNNSISSYSNSFLKLNVDEMNLNHRTSNPRSSIC